MLHCVFLCVLLIHVHCGYTDGETGELNELLQTQGQQLKSLQTNLFSSLDEMKRKIDDVSAATRNLQSVFSSKLIGAVASVNNNVGEQSKYFLKRMDVLEGGVRQSLRRISTRVNKCPIDYLGNAHGCYKFYIGHVCWNDARKRCRDDGAHLVAIETGSEMEALKHLIRLHGFSKNWFWIGGNDRGSEGSWVWESSGQKITYNNWRKGEKIKGADH